MKKQKAFLSWTKEDYRDSKMELPPCLENGTTEGEAMNEDEVQEWAREEFQTLLVLREQYPEKFEEQYQLFLLDLDYLCSLGKITQEEKEKLGKKENFNFGRE